MTSLPTNIDATYPDDGQPGRKAHQQQHDIIHQELNDISNGTGEYASVSLPNPEGEADGSVLVVLSGEWVVGGPTLTQDDLDTHIADTTAVHGIADTSVLATTTDLDNLKAASAGFVNHGATAGTARPTGYAMVVWVGTVTPSNAVDGDIFIDMS